MKLVVFDVDGTLIDSQARIVSDVQAGFQAIGLPVPAAGAIRAVIGLSLPASTPILMPDLDEAARAEAVTRLRTVAAARPKRGPLPLFPGARAALDRLAARDDMFLGVATGKSRRGLDELFGQLGLDGYFITRQTADGHPSKPDPAMLCAALDEAVVAPGQAVMVGDTTFDIEMGRAAGVATIGVGWGYHPAGDLRVAGADLVIEDFDALDAAVDALLGEKE